MKILYATDGSHEAAAAAAFLARFPHQDDASVHILTILGQQDPDDSTATISAARAALNGFPGQVTSETKWASGNEAIADTILLTAVRDNVDLIALGSTSHTGLARFFLGSVAEAVSHNTSRAVLVARPSTGPLKNIVFGVDGSWSAHDAACFAISMLPLPMDCVLHLVEVVTPAREGVRGTPIFGPPEPVWREAFESGQEGARRYLETLVHELQADGRPIVHKMRTGLPGNELVYAAAEYNADLIVVGAQGMSGMERALLGSVSDHLIRHALCSVLVVKSSPPPLRSALEDTSDREHSLVAEAPAGKIR